MTKLPRSLRLQALVFVLAVISLGRPLAASTSTQYSDVDSFMAAVLNVQTISFKAPSPSEFVTVTPYTDPTTGLVFSVPPGQFLDIVGSQYYTGAPYTEDFLVPAASSGGPVFVTPPPGTTAVGIHYGGFAGGPFRFVLSNGDAYDVPAGPALGTLGFIGFSSDRAIAYVIIGATATDPIVIGDVLIGAPVCDLQLTQTSYANGETVSASVLRLANHQAVSVPAEIKVWIRTPGAPNIPIINAGADGSVELPPGYDVNFGPLDLFVVTDRFPSGLYEFSCRIVDPKSGRTLSAALNAFTIP